MINTVGEGREECMVEREDCIRACGSPCLRCVPDTGLIQYSNHVCAYIEIVLA